MTTFTPNTPIADQISANLALIGLAQDFLYSATTYGKIIISEVYLDDREKTIKPVELGPSSSSLSLDHKARSKKKKKEKLISLIM